MPEIKTRLNQTSQEAPDVHPGLRAGRTIRFAIWIIAVVSVLVSQRFSSIWLIAICLACLLVILLLLCTTPKDAIRLPRWISEAIIILSTTLPGLPLQRQVSVVHLTILLSLLILLRLARTSPWWAVLYGWFPILLIHGT